MFSHKDSETPLDLSGTTYKNKTVIITGGANGIGKGCARVFVEAGSNVVILDIDGEAGRALEKYFNEKRMGSCFFIEGDASDETTLKKLFAEAAERYTTIDCLINNAGVHPPLKRITEFSKEEFMRTLEINLIGPFMACQQALPHLVKSRGSIINIGSLVGQIGQEGATTYSAAKAGLDGFIKAFVLELGDSGVRVNNLAPSNILTESRKKGVAQLGGDPVVIDDWIDRNQLHGKSGTPEDVGKTCLVFATGLMDMVQGESLALSYGAQLGYGIKYPMTFLNQRLPNKKLDNDREEKNYADNPSPNAKISKPS